MTAELEDTGTVPVMSEGATTRNGALQPTLVCVSGSEMGKSFQVGMLQSVIGRSNADINLGDRDISRRHARIAIGNQGFELEDLGSVNGTLINGQRITGKVPLSVGDRIQVGRTVLVFTVHDELEKRVEAMLRLEAMATLAGGIAHDFNNALAVIVWNIDVLNESIPKTDTDGHQSLEQVRHAAQNATLLARKLLRLGRSDQQPFAPVAIGELAADTAAMARRRTKRMIEIAVEIPSYLQVFGNADELRQVLLNLCFNACDAMQNGGRLTLSARPVWLDAQGAVACQLPAPGDYVELSVSDTGHGMDRNTLARVFEPFFTTKSRDEGTGLGLSMVHTVVRRHAGAIEVESHVGHGTTFRLLLPRPNLATVDQSRGMTA